MMKGQTLHLFAISIAIYPTHPIISHSLLHYTTITLNKNKKKTKKNKTNKQQQTKKLELTGSFLPPTLINVLYAKSTCHIIMINSVETGNTRSEIIPQKISV
ncbi:hypothetical protein NL108_008885 [Boleophthalmus pectinirostris]|nr:hypothetical protein NL108_008885 [Boleophthalmus pectinirostris]